MAALQFPRSGDCPGAGPISASCRQLSVWESPRKSQPKIMAQWGECLGEEKRKIPGPFHVLFSGVEYLEISKAFDNSKQLVKLPCFQVCIHIAERGESIRNDSCTDFWRASGLFFSKDILSIACCLLLHNT